MNIDGAVLTFAGTVVLLGLALALLFSPWWLLLDLFAALNMIQAGMSGWCPAAIIFRRLGLKPGINFH